MVGEERMCEIAVGEPMNLKFHSGGIMETMCENSAGRWGRGLVSTTKASFLGSYGEGGDGGGGHFACGSAVQVVVGAEASSSVDFIGIEISRAFQGLKVKNS
jgi:hypothetical protein